MATKAPYGTDTTSGQSSPLDTADTMTGVATLERGDSGAVSLYEDANTTAITIGGGTNQTAVTVGGGAAYTGTTIGKANVADKFAGGLHIGSGVGALDTGDLTVGLAGAGRFVYDQSQALGAYYSSGNALNIVMRGETAQVDVGYLTDVGVRLGASGLTGNAATSADTAGQAISLTGGAGNGTGAGGALTLTTGAGGATGNSGDVTVDVGAVTGGTAGNVNIGTTTATSVTIGRSGQTTTVAGDFVVQGTKYINESTTTLYDDNHLYLNNGYTTAVAETGGLVVNYLPTSTVDTVAATGFTAGSDGISNPTVITGTGGVFSLADLIQISGSTSNDGLYEVLSHSGTTLIIRGIGTTATVEDFTQNQFETEAGTGNIYKVNVSILRSDISGDWEQGKGSTTPVTFGGMATSADWETVLSNGATTGAYNPTINTGQKLLGAAELTLEATGANEIQLRTNSTDQWSVSSGGALLSDNAGDIGATASGRPTHIYALTDVVVASTATLSGTALTGTGALQVTSGGSSALSLDSASGIIETNATALTADGALTVTATSAVLSLDGSTLETNATSLTADAAFSVSATGAATDLTLGARGSTITLNESGEESLDASFSATSIVGALNEVQSINGSLVLTQKGEVYRSTDETPPTDSTIGTDVNTLLFADATDAEIETTFVVPDCWDGVSSAEISLVFATSDSNSGNIALATEGKVVDVGGTTLTTLVATNYTLAAPTDTDPHRSATIRTIVAGDLSAGSIVTLKFARRGSSQSGTDTYAGGLQLVDILFKLSATGNATASEQKHLGFGIFDIVSDSGVSADTYEDISADFQIWDKVDSTIASGRADVLYEGRLNTNQASVTSIKVPVKGSGTSPEYQIKVYVEGAGNTTNVYTASTKTTAGTSRSVVTITSAQLSSQPSSEKRYYVLVEAYLDASETLYVGRPFVTQE